MTYTGRAPIPPPKHKPRWDADWPLRHPTLTTIIGLTITALTITAAILK